MILSLISFLLKNRKFKNVVRHCATHPYPPLILKPDNLISNQNFKNSKINNSTKKYIFSEK